MGFWAIAAPIFGSIASAYVGKDGADKQNALSGQALHMTENARQEAKQALSHPALMSAGDQYFPGVMPAGGMRENERFVQDLQTEGLSARSPQGLTPRAQGGPVETGEDYLVGEEGPEVMVPEQDGVIIPNHELGGGGAPPMGGGGDMGMGGPPPGGGMGIPGGGNEMGGMPPEFIQVIQQIVVQTLMEIMSSMGGAPGGAPGGMGAMGGDPMGGGAPPMLPPAGGGGGGMDPMMGDGGGMPPMGPPPGGVGGGGMGMPPPMAGLEVGGLPGRAFGGPVEAGQPYQVGEQGMEGFRPTNQQPQPQQAAQPAAPANRQAPGFSNAAATPSTQPGVGDLVSGSLQRRAANPGQLSPITYERAQGQINMGQNMGAQEIAGGLTQSGVDPSSPGGQAMMLANNLGAARLRNEAARDYSLMSEQLTRTDEQAAWGQYMQALQAIFGLGQAQAGAASGQGFPSQAVVNPYANWSEAIATAGSQLGQYFQNRPQQQLAQRHQAYWDEGNTGPVQ